MTADYLVILQRTYVLCRLIKKPGRTTEGGGDALACDEGEINENQAIAGGIPSVS